MGVDWEGGWLKGVDTGASEVRNQARQSDVSQRSRLPVSSESNATLLPIWRKFNRCQCGVAKYVRTVAKRGAGLSIGSLPNTRAAFPNVNLGLFASHSGSWTDDNIRVLGMYYTSRAWADDVCSAGRGKFVFEAYRDVQSTGLFP
jgi:hypothetical protein